MDSFGDHMQQIHRKRMYWEKKKKSLLYILLSSVGVCASDLCVYEHY